jgi:hypothetical protein
MAPTPPSNDSNAPFIGTADLYTDYAYETTASHLRSPKLSSSRQHSVQRCQRPRHTRYRKNLKEGSAQATRPQTPTFLPNARSPPR